MTNNKQGKVEKVDEVDLIIPDPKTGRPILIVCGERKQGRPKTRGGEK